MNEKIKVYIKLDTNVVVEINSSIFLTDTTDYICIDEGEGDKYAHAQSQYLELGLMDEKGRYNYKVIGKTLLPLNEMEKELLFPAPEVQPTTEERLNALESAMLEMIMGGLE